MHTFGDGWMYFWRIFTSSPWAVAGFVTALGVWNIVAWELHAMIVQKRRLRARQF